MGRANKQPGAGIAGVLVADKAAGFTSMDAVALIRGKAGGVKTGHAGTLDPFAEGLLIIVWGRATSLVPYLHEYEKTTADDPGPCHGNRYPEKSAPGGKCVD